MAVKYKNLDEERQNTVREIRRDEMLYGVDPGYSVVDGYDPYSADVVAGRGSYGIADNAFMNDADWNAVQLYKQNWANAQTDAERAYWHDMAQQVRYGYGYSGGEDGSQHIGIVANTAGMPSTKGNNEPVRVSSEHAAKLGVGYGNGGADGSKYNTIVANTEGMPSTKGNNEPVRVSSENAAKLGVGYGNSNYNSQYQARIDALTDAILNREAFVYDKETDPLYQQYKESYTRGGQRGMQDTLAQVSARTGGLASSYAQSAAQQTYNNYMAALADKVPELQQLAYSMYMDDIAMDRADLDMLMGLDNTDYGRWSDDRNFNYGAYRDSVADAQWQQNFNYQQAQNALAQQNWQSQFDYQMAQDALAQQNWQTQWDYNVLQDELARQDALAKLQAAAGGNPGYRYTGTPDVEDAAESGVIPSTMLTQLQATYADGNMPADAWNAAVGLYGEEALTDAGFRQQQTGAAEVSDYQFVVNNLNKSKREGVSYKDILYDLESARKDGLLTEAEYQTLKKRYAE